jgi:hypothetical protein
MEVMIDCICNGNLRRLIIEGEPSQAELEEAWDNLYIEYCDLVGNSKGLRMARDIKFLEAKLSSCLMCLYDLKTTYSPDCIKILHEYGYRRKFDYNDPESYTTDIKAVEVQLGAVVIQIRQAKIYYDMEKPQSPKKFTEQKFYETLAAINNHNKNHVSMKDLTAYEFAMLYSALKKEIELGGK